MNLELACPRQMSLEDLRSLFCGFLAGNEQFFTLALGATCKFVLEDEFPYIAAIALQGSPVVHVRRDFLEADLPNKVKFLVLHHEIFHIVQMKDIPALIDLVDLSPLGMKPAKSNEGFRFDIVSKAADAALHESLMKLYGQGTFDTLNEWLRSQPLPPQQAVQEKMLDAMNIPGKGVTEERVRASMGCIQVPRLNTFKDFKTLEPDSETFQIVGKYVDWLATWMEPNADGSNGESEGNAGPDGFDSHDFGDGTQNGEAAEAARRAVEGAIAEAKRMAHQAGKEAADLPKHCRAAQLSERTRRLLQKMKAKTAVLTQKAKNIRYSFEKPHVLFPEIDYTPGKCTNPKTSRSFILILDTSGSMFDDGVLQRLVGAAAVMEKAGLVSAIYCGDTCFHRVQHQDNLKELNLRGGGGTSLYPADLRKIKEELGITKPCTFLYMTDECCSGLEESKAASKKEWDLHVLNEKDIT